MKYPLLLASVLLAAVPAHAGMKSVCTHGEQIRVIEVVYQGDSNVPCDVVYTKDTGASVLWSAQNESGYCEQKAEEFTQKQRDWGWNCETSMSEISAADIQAEPVAETAETEEIVTESPASETEPAAPAAE